MRARLEALCKRWNQQAAKAEAEVEGREGAGAWGLAGNIVGTRQCAADLCALLAETSRVRMEPQPPNTWIRWTRLKGPRSWKMELANTIETITAPSPVHRPVLVDGVWWWEVQP